MSTLASTGYRATDVVTVACHGRQEFTVLSVDVDTMTVRACRITPSQRPGRRTFTFPVAALTLVARYGTY
jgi:hypothetical protein